MSKRIILSNINKLVDAVVAQQKNIIMLKRGVSLDVDSMSTKEQCAFLSWFREDGRYLKIYVHGSTLDEVSALYSQWFESYERIYKLFYNDSKKGWLFKKKSKAKTLTEMEQAKVEAYVDDMTDFHLPLLRKLQILQRRVEHNTVICDDDYYSFVENNTDYKVIAAV